MYCTVLYESVILEYEIRKYKSTNEKRYLRIMCAIHYIG